jgi:uncharacterized membrane protein
MMPGLRVNARINSRLNAMGAAALASVVCAVLVVAAGSLLRVVAGLLLAFVLPGPGLLWSCFPRRSIVAPEEVVVAAGLSLGSVAVVGVLLHTSGVGLSPASWAWSLALLTCVASGVASWRIARVETDEGTASHERVKSSAAGSTTVDRRRLAVPAMLIALAVVLVGASATLAVVSDRNQPVAGATELSALPRTAGSSLTLIVQVTSHESAAAQYQLVIHGDKGLATRTTLRLEPGESWSRTFPIPSAQRVDVDLYLDESVTVYRSVFVSADAW